MSEKIYPPWDDETVAALNAFQAAAVMHPFTCGAEHIGNRPDLVATRDGWACSDAPQCGYTQDWAHAFMTTERARTPFWGRLRLTE